MVDASLTNIIAPGGQLIEKVGSCKGIIKKKMCVCIYIYVTYYFNLNQLKVQLSLIFFFFSIGPSSCLVFDCLVDVPIIFPLTFIIRLLYFLAFLKWRKNVKTSLKHCKCRILLDLYICPPVFCSCLTHT